MQQLEVGITASIRAYLAESFFVDMPRIFDDTSFMDSGVLDSVGFLQMVVFLEHTFGISIKDAEMIPENMDSIQSLRRFIERKKRETPSL
jgi:acyl carrier protein